MSLRFSAISACVLLVLTACSTGSQSSSPSSPTPHTVTATLPPPTPSVPAGPAAITPVIGSVLAPPMPVPATDGKTHLAYELVLTNTSPGDVTLMSLAALSGDRTLFTLSGDGLANSTRILGNPVPSPTLGSAQTALVWIDIALDDAAAVPTGISHALAVSVAQPQPPLTEAAMTETVAPTTVDGRKPVTVSPPLRGDNWVDGNGCCDLTPHRLAVSPLNGQLWASERYAIDFVQLTPDGRLTTGDKDKLESYPYYGADVSAVADGQVVAVVDNLAEQVPGANPPGLSLDQYAGNHVVQDIGGGNFVLYAHLNTGSVKVKPGDKLTTGQVLGSLGNSGNTDMPHLHFELMSTADPLRSNGLPFVFDRLRLDSRVVPGDMPTDVPVPMQHGVTASDQTYRMPLHLDVTSFAAR